MIVNMKVFIAGPRAITALDEQVKARLDNVMKNEMTVLVGDANGVDRTIQNYLHSAQHNAVLVYASGGKPRNNAANWPIVAVNAGKSRGFDFYAAKDLQMAIDADYGFMIWNGISKGTLNNIINLTRLGKKSLVYFTPQKEFICVDSYDKLNELVHTCDNATIRLYESLMRQEKRSPESEQMALNVMNG